MKYVVKMMSMNDYNNMMLGGLNYVVHDVEIEAETAAEAIIEARNKYRDMIINDYYAKPVEVVKAEFDRKVKEFEAFKKEQEEKKAAEKAKREAKEKAKAEAAGMSVEEYKAELKKAKKVKKLEDEIKELEALLANKKAALEELNK